MENPFFDHPILNSPYEIPTQHWEIDKDTKQPTQRIIKTRRRADFYTPIPKSRKQKNEDTKQKTLGLSDADELSTEDQEYSATAIINQVRDCVDVWRRIPDPSNWGVTPETARLLQHWRHHDFSGIKPFFCQIEAAETVIWLTEAASNIKDGRHFIEHIKNANYDANPNLTRLALKLATGAGKTTVMAMLIAWQTVNAIRHPQSRRFTRGFLIVTPGITIKDRLRVLYPNDPDSYYASRELAPADMLQDIGRAKIVITNYHAFKPRERIEISKGGRGLLKGRHSDEELNTAETEGQMLQRVMPNLMGMKNIFVINDEAHHCYREKPRSGDNEKLTGDEKAEAEKNNEAARLWISGLETVGNKLGIANVIDLSATPFFLRGSGYAEGTLFPWTMSDFSLMDAIECGIVKLPRVPVAENIPGGEMPKFRDLWENIKRDMPKKGRGKASALDPLSIPTLLQNALQALYGHYEKTFKLWEDAKISVSPCFIIVCNNTSTSKLLYDYIAGFKRELEDGGEQLEMGRLSLFRNFDENGNPYDMPRTLLIDSEQLESGEGLDDTFRKNAADEIERFRRERIERSGDSSQGENITDHDLLREVMNTVGKPGQLGHSIRCVVSVSMLTEGWDANTVTHVLGVRAFGTQLLCEQVIGRALRRQSYDLNDEGLFDVEYADVFGIPFDFTARPVVAPPQKPAHTIQVRAVTPERDPLEIRFPSVAGYRTELPEEKITANFTKDSVLTLTPDLLGPSETLNAGIIGMPENMDVSHMINDMRKSSLVMYLTKHLLDKQFRDVGQRGDYHLFNQFKSVVREWLDTPYLDCKGGTNSAQLMYLQLSDMACERIQAAIVRSYIDTQPVKAILDPYNPEGSTMHVRFNTSKTDRWETDSRKCHINWVILDSDWEGEFCRVVESHPNVFSYVKNHSLGFEVPYQLAGASRIYRPDFIALVNDGHGPDDLLRLVIEIKGYRGEDAKVKKETMDTYWIPGVNALGTFGRWAFAEFTDVYEIEKEFDSLIKRLANT